jgi:hypothetical protein
MFKALGDLFSNPRSEEIQRLAGYEAIGGEEEDSRHGQQDSLSPGWQRTSDEKGVYWAFWVLGAGVLLAWNGEIFPHMKQLASIRGERTKDSAHLYNAAAVLVFPGRFTSPV